jgi:hypothetical protein
VAFEREPHAPAAGVVVEPEGVASGCLSVAPEAGFDARLLEPLVVVRAGQLLLMNEHETPESTGKRSNDVAHLSRTAQRDQPAHRTESRAE